MPARTLLPGLTLGLLGLLLIGWLVLRRRDVHRAAHHASPWRQRLLVAGLILLASVGFLPTSWAAGGPKGPPGIESNDSWTRIAKSWAEGEHYAVGARGSYPFDRATKTRVLDELTAAQGLADTLAREGQIQPATAALVKLELQYVARGVSSKRPTEMRNATCYKPMVHRPAQDALRRIEQRLPLLEKLARGKRVQAAVLRKVVAAVERDLKVAGGDKKPAVRRTRASLAKIKTLLSR